MKMKWTDEEKILLKKLYPKEKNDILINVFKRDIKSIREIARKMGIKRIEKENSWNNKDIVFLRKNFENADWNYLCEKLNKNKSTIFNKGASLGLKRNQYRWTEEKDNIVRKFYENGERDFVCELLDNSWQNIMARASRIGVKRHYRTTWTDEKIEILKNFYPKTDWNTLLNILEIDPKDIELVKSKIKSLGLRREYYSKEDDVFIEKNYKTMSNKDLCVALNIDNPIVIRSYLSRHGFRRLVDWNKYSDNELLNLLYNLSIKINRIPLYSELTEYGLPSPEIYRRRFGEYHIALEKAGLDVIALYGRPCYSKNGDWCLSATEAKITNFLIDNNIKYRKNILYKNIIPIKTNHRTDWILDDGTIVEYFGLSEKEKYKEKMNFKIELCKQYNLNLISIYQRNIKIKDLKHIFEKYINNKYP